MFQFDFYFRKKITEAIMEEIQASAEAALNRSLAARGIYGVRSGSSYTVVPDVGWTLEIDSGTAENWSGFDRDGQFVDLGENPHVTADLLPLFTIPTVSPKWVTFFVAFAREPLQPEADPAGLVVYVRQEESFTIEAISGAEGGGKPAIAASENRLYLCDVQVPVAATDFTGTIIEIDETRMTIDPLAEAVERGLDGTEIKFLLGDQDLQDALTAAAASPANPLVTAGVIVGARAYSHSEIVAADALVITENPWNANVRSILVIANSEQAVGNTERSHGCLWIDVSGPTNAIITRSSVYADAVIPNVLATHVEGSVAAPFVGATSGTTAYPVNQGGGPTQPYYYLKTVDVPNRHLQIGLDGLVPSAGHVLVLFFK